MAKNKKEKDEDGGFLDRFFRPWKTQRVSLTKADGKQAPLRKRKAAPKKAVAKAAPKKTVAKAVPKTMRERQVQELKTLASIGKRDPERLAAIISRILNEAKEQDQEDQLKFERLIWEKAEKRKPQRPEKEGDVSGGEE
ncbi:MAG: hypothetical protein O2954_09470 [bacterium]|nr:hypothetical protein [bacterium]